MVNYSHFNQIQLYVYTGELITALIIKSIQDRSNQYFFIYLYSENVQEINVLGL